MSTGGRGANVSSGFRASRIPIPDPTIFDGVGHLWLGIALLAALYPQTARAAFISLDVPPTGNELEFNVQDFLNAESGFSLVKVDEPAPIALLGLVLVGCALVRGERRQVARRF